MADTKEEIFKYLELNPESDWKEVKAAFDEKFVKADPSVIKSRTELYGGLLAEVNGAILGKVKGLAKSLGIELTSEDIKDKKTVEVIEFLNAKSEGVLSGYTTKLSELETEVKDAKKSGASAKDVEKLQQEVEAWKQKHNDVNGLLQNTVTEFDSYKNNVAEKENNFVISQYKNAEISKVKLKTASDYERKGWLSEVDSKYQLQRDGDNVIVRDKEGKQVPNPDKAGAFMTYSEVLLKEAKEAKLLDDNPHTGKTIQRPQPAAIPGAESGEKYVVKSPYLRD
jgi:phage-related minor tail protein